MDVRSEGKEIEVLSDETVKLLKITDDVCDLICSAVSCFWVIVSSAQRVVLLKTGATGRNFKEKALFQR